MPDYFAEIKASWVMTDATAAAQSLVSILGLTPESILALPSDWRDKLLEYLLNWGEPQELLDVIATLRQGHAAPMHLLDMEAHGLTRLGRHADALSVIETRLRRSPSVAALAFEVTTLGALGNASHALDAAEKLLRAYPNSVTAVASVVEIFSQHGEFERCHTLLESLLRRHAGNPRILVALAKAALASGDPPLTDDYLQRLGSDKHKDMAETELMQLAELHRAVGNIESAGAVELELERRRLACISDLHTLLARPLADPSQESRAVERNIRLLNGPETISVSEGERRRIVLEATRHFGFTDLREGQTEIIAAVLRGESALAVMPTGVGKSLCYQLPALLLPGATLVISPLIALMKDQVENLPAAEKRRATFINSTLSEEEWERRMIGVVNGDYKLIYAAPERLRHLSFLRSLRRTGVSLFVVDEAHCLSMWGHDFRPDYLFLRTARAELGNPTALAMTATAPPRVRDEIIDHISDQTDAPHADSDQAKGKPVDRPHVLALDIFRENMHLSARQFQSEEEKATALASFVAAATGSGIVYVNSRRKCETLAYHLRQSGVDAEAYHAGLEGRAQVQDRFMSGETRVIVATIAFGMGIDKPNIRFIVHFHPPRSLASYYQEVGRAGRDGDPCQAVLFYSPSDWSNLRRWIRMDEYSVNLLERVYVAVASQLGVLVEFASEQQGDLANVDAAISADGNTDAVGPVDLHRIQQVLDIDETAVRVGISLLEQVGLLVRGFDYPAQVEIRLPDQQPQNARVTRSERRFLKGLGLSWGESAAFALADVASFMQWSPAEAEPKLLDLEDRGLLIAHFERRTSFVHLTAMQADFRMRIERTLEQTAAVAQRTVDEMIGYATTKGCRHGYISAYLGSRPIHECPVCDNCTGIGPDLPEPEVLPPLDIDDDEIEPMILDCLVSLVTPVGRGGLARILAGSLRAPAAPDGVRHFGRLKALGTESIVRAIDGLMQQGLLRQYDRNGYPILAVTLKGRDQARRWLNSHPELCVIRVPEQPEASAGKFGDEPGQRYTKLQTAIWAWRKRIAEEIGQPPYVIMDNELILRIAQARPQSLDDMRTIPGIGAQRLEHYGPALLDLVRLHPPEVGDDALLNQQQSASSSSRAPAQRAHTARVPPHVERLIFLKLQEIRQREAVRFGCSASAVASTKVLRSIAAAAPESAEELLRVPGFRSSGLRDEAAQICQVVQDALGA